MGDHRRGEPLAVASFLPLFPDRKVAFHTIASNRTSGIVHLCHSSWNFLGGWEGTRLDCVYATSCLGHSSAPRGVASWHSRDPGGASAAGPNAPYHWADQRELGGKEGAPARATICARARCSAATFVVERHSLQCGLLQNLIITTVLAGNLAETLAAMGDPALGLAALICDEWLSGPRMCWRARSHGPTTDPHIIHLPSELITTKPGRRFGNRLRMSMGSSIRRSKRLSLACPGLEFRRLCLNRRVDPRAPRPVGGRPVD